SLCPPYETSRHCERSEAISLHLRLRRDGRDCFVALRAPRNDAFGLRRRPSFSRASFAPAPSAASLAIAMSRRIGAMPQLVHGLILSFATYFAASAITAATCAGVSTVSVATSIAPISTSLPSSSLSRFIGTLELRHSSET